jgi:hypothetical protein
MIRRLGTEPDSSLARRYGISKSAVLAKRHSLEIESHQPAVARTPQRSSFWTAEREALLGTDSDQKIADRLGVAIHVVQHRRKSLGIPAANPRKYIDWKPIDPLLGKEADAALAERFGISPDSVRLRRLKLGIAPARGERRTLVRNSSLKRLLGKPTQEITEISASEVHILRHELGVPYPPRRTRWTEENLARLGREPDQAIASDFGISVASVRQMRYKHGIQIRNPRPPWTVEEIRILELHPDNEVARRLLKRSAKAIRHKRAELRRRR